jgi:hypothetical protein
MLLGRLDSESHMAVPESTINASMRWYSSGDPSHQCTKSGFSMGVTSSSQLESSSLSAASRVAVAVFMFLSSVI